MIKNLLTLLFIVNSFALSAAGYFKWTPQARSAYESVIELRLEAAEKKIAALKKREPDNLIRHHLENYVDFFKVYINEDKAEFERLEANKDRRLAAIKTGDSYSPYKLYLQADIRMQWALARLKFEEYATAFFETNKAFKLLEENSKKYPHFMPNKKNLGILYSISGAIPDNYKWLVETLTNLHGTQEDGQNALRTVIDFAGKNDFIYDTETYVFYSYLMLHLGNDEKAAWQIINESGLRPERSPLATFVKANIAMRTDRNDEAVRILLNRPQGTEFSPFPYLDFMTGLAKVRRLDKDADTYFNKYLNAFKGRNFIKETHRYLAWHGLVHGSKETYRTEMEEVKKNGFTIVGGDESALKEAEKGEVPDVNLLKARLLFDGGYYQKAHDLLIKKTVSMYEQSRYELEHNYRMGRILHKMKNYDPAIVYYDRTIEAGRNEIWYFACRAALEKGRIYETLGDKEKARTAYKDCQTIKPAEHKTGLHATAKAGLSRLK